MAIYNMEPTHEVPHPSKPMGAISIDIRTYAGYYPRVSVVERIRRRMSRKIRAVIQGGENTKNYDK